MRMLPVLPDESLFSRFCRTTTVYGMSPSSLLTIIFNKPDMNVHPILNSGLKAISLHTSESADQLWHEQTLLPLFAWALPISSNEIMDFNTTPARLNRLCRLSNFSLGQRTLLKFCPVCAREDTFHYGVTYWHMSAICDEDEKHLASSGCLAKRWRKSDRNCEAIPSPRNFAPTPKAFISRNKNPFGAACVWNQI